MYLKKGEEAFSVLSEPHGNAGGRNLCHVHRHMLGFLLQSSDLKHRGGGEEGSYTLQFSVSSAPCSEQKVKPFWHLPLIPNTDSCGIAQCIPLHNWGRPARSLLEISLSAG